MATAASKITILFRHTYVNFIVDLKGLDPKLSQVWPDSRHRVVAVGSTSFASLLCYSCQGTTLLLVLSTLLAASQPLVATAASKNTTLFRHTYAILRASLFNGSYCYRCAPHRSSKCKKSARNKLTPRYLTSFYKQISANSLYFRFRSFY